MVAHTMAPNRFEQGEGSDQVGGNERRGVVERVVVVRLGREMHDEVAPSDETVDQFCVGDIPDDEPNLIGDDVQRRRVGGVGELVQDGDVDVGTGGQGAEYKVDADEAGAPGDQYPHGAPR